MLFIYHLPKCYPLIQILNLKIYVAFHSLEQLNVSRVFCFMILIFCLYGRYNVEVKATPAFSRQL